MSSLVILFLAIIALIVPLNNIVDSAPSSALDIDKILELVQQKQRNVVNKPRRLQLRKDSSDSDSDSDSTDYFSYVDDDDDSDNNRYAELNDERIIDLIDRVANEKTKGLHNEGRNIHRKGKSNYRQKNIVSRSEKHTNSAANNNAQTQLLEQILSRAINEEERKNKQRASYPKKRLVPNRLTGSKNDIKKDYRNDDAVGLEDYSKVYIVLNPQAVRKSKNKNSLNDLISKVLALSSPVSKRERQTKPRRYKGFVVKDSHVTRRSRVRESKEMYAPRDSIGDDYSTKRQRNSGNTGGRTAIPYIRHRGDIYERDN